MRFPLFLIISAAVMAGSIAPDLRSEIAVAGNNDLIPVFILAQGQLDASWVASATVGMDFIDNRDFVVDALMDMADVSQTGIIEDLNGRAEETVANVQSLWLANAVYCETTVDVIREIAGRDDVQLVESAASPDAGLIEPVEVRRPTPEETDGLAWGVSKINADDAWALGYNGSGIIVGVIDTGTDYNHIDLHNNMWHDTAAGYHNGYDFYNGDGDPMDDYGHGTHVSGTVLGLGNGGTQTGVAPGATCMALRINYYTGGESTWIQAMQFGTAHGARVLTMSLGSTHGNTTLRTAEQNLLTAGIYHSVAAGNSGPGAGTILSSGDSPPPWFHPQQTQHGGQSAVVTCGATNSSDVIADFSSRGPVTWWTDYPTSGPLIDPDISGPGVDVVSTQWGGGYTTMSGTSMATPHVAGVAALILDANPALTVAQMDQIIETTSVDLGTAGKENTYGAGRVDAYQAVLAALAVGVDESTAGVVAPGLLVSEISPNPVSNFASFQVYTATPGRIDVCVFDLSGREVALIDRDVVGSGSHSYGWAVPAGISNGIYFVRATVGDSSAISRLTVVR